MTKTFFDTMTAQCGMMIGASGPGTGGLTDGGVNDSALSISTTGLAGAKQTR